MEGFTNEVRQSSQVAGWGTLITPAGAAPTLQIRTKTVSTITLVIPEQPPFVMTDSSYTLTFMTAGGASVVLSLDSDGAVTDASYSFTGTSTAAWPEPAGPSALRLLVNGPQPVRQGDVVTLAIGLDAAGRHVSTPSTCSGGLCRASPTRPSLPACTLSRGRLRACRVASTCCGSPAAAR